MSTSRTFPPLHGTALGGSAYVPVPAPDPDAVLLRLGREFEAAVAAEMATWAVAEHYTAEEQENQADAVHAPIAALMDEIISLRATTLAGMKVKARAVSYCWSGKPVTAEELTDHGDPTTDVQLIASLMADLAEGGT
jgi:hypothetical protein